MLLEAVLCLADNAVQLFIFCKFTVGDKQQILLLITEASHCGSLASTQNWDLEKKQPGNTFSLRATPLIVHLLNKFTEFLKVHRHVVSVANLTWKTKIFAETKNYFVHIKVAAIN